MSDPLLSPGMVIGETWEIIEPLGRGGMGEVWLAKHRRVEGKQAAIKILRRTTDGMPDQVARFQREAEIAARLEHPNIVQLFDFSSLPSGEPYIVMELLRGESLGKRLSRGPMPLAELQEVVVAIGSALHVAHAAGVVHRDLKPENIFLVSTATGITVKVLDFGISKLVDSDSLMTSEDIVLGTPQYMSPEQAMAEHQAITGQSDLFSLGTICFEALTGHRPFAATTLARTVYLVAMEPSPSLRTYGPELPAQAIDAVDHALAKQPGDRTPDAATFVKEFCGVTLGKSAGQSLSQATPAPSVDSETRAQVAPKISVPPERSRGAPAPRVDSPTKEISVPPERSRGTPEPLLPSGVEARAPRRVLQMVAIAAAVMVGVGVLVTSSRQPEVAAPLDAGVVAMAMVDDVVPKAIDAGVALVDAPTPHPIDAGVPHHARAQPASPEQQALLDSAHAAASRNDWTQVIEWTLKPAIAERVDAISLRVLAWCHLGNLSMVNAYKARVGAGERGNVARACRSQGIDL